MSSLHESDLTVKGEKRQRTDKHELRLNSLVSKKAGHRHHLLRLRPIQSCTMATQCHVAAQFPLVRCSHPRNQVRVRLWDPAKQVSSHLSNPNRHVPDGNTTIQPRTHIKHKLHNRDKILLRVSGIGLKETDHGILRASLTAMPRIPEKAKGLRISTSQIKRLLTGKSA